LGEASKPGILPTAQTQSTHKEPLSEPPNMFQPGDYGEGTFNGSDLKAYSKDDKLQNLRENSSLEGRMMEYQLGEPKRSQNMSKRCSKPRGNTKKVKGCLSRL